MRTTAIFKTSTGEKVVITHNNSDPMSVWCEVGRKFLRDCNLCKFRGVCDIVVDNRPMDYII